MFKVVPSWPIRRSIHAMLGVLLVLDVISIDCARRDWDGYMAIRDKL